ncbi:EF-hand calcium-binding domain-containing protein 4B-like isoform X2 [Lineus longissimus]|uniref:EF-hand calcium-binding domain-containing protein 4B-like isoform X2 n=1 Tax=Lineus longissimus TaxID=88925 RepID=UPI002B4DECF0
MATYTDQQFDGNATSMDIEELMVAKAHELFAICDQENKGFITKRDMQRLQSELPLNPDQLESVFDSLDDDGNGFLTLEEFTGGFGSFIGIQKPIESQVSVDSGSNMNSSHVYETDQLGIDSADEEEHFNESMHHIGATGVFDDQSSVKELWLRLRRDEPEMLSQFEDFLTKITSEVKRTQSDYENLENVLRNKAVTHDEEVRRLYDEMENQIKAEKERILQAEKQRERQLKDELERELIEKDKQLQELLNKHGDMEKKLAYLNMMDAETKQENDRLLKEKMEIENELQDSQINLEESQTYIDQLRRQQKDEKRDRARNAFQISEGIALERESLVKQLDMLREVNKKLKDEKEESWLKFTLGERAPDTRGSNETAPGKQGEGQAAADTVDGSDSSKKGMTYSTLSRQDTQSKRSAFVKQGSILSNYFDEPSSRRMSEDIDEEDDIECDDTLIEHNTANQPQFHVVQDNGNMAPFEDRRRRNSFRRYQSLDLLPGVSASVMDDVTSSDNESGRSFSRNDRQYSSLRVPPKRNQQYSDSDSMEGSPRQRRDKKTRRSPNGYGPESDDDDYENRPVPDSPRGQPVGGSVDVSPVELPEVIPTTPERVFKVVFVGDSGVGKSSFIYRFCNDAFKDSFSATIGVDFQVKNVIVDKHLIALQLWDTAGQERFRSITKQYFRKADGVIVMYDVTSESSFTNVRNWMVSVQEGVEDNTVVMLLGNKTDLAQNDEHRVVKEKDGTKLADIYNAIFYETSAKTGDNIKECVEAISRLLREKEDQELEDALRLEEPPKGVKKKGCCS